MAPAAQRANASDSEDDLAQSDLRRSTDPIATNGVTSEVERASSNMQKSTGRGAKSAGRRAANAAKNTATSGKRKATTATAPPRRALSDRTNIPAGSEVDVDADDVDDIDMDMEAVKPRTKRAKTTATAAPAAARKSTTKDAKPAAKRGRPTKNIHVANAHTASAERLEVIPESQAAEPEHMSDVEESIEVEPDSGVPEVPRPEAPRYVALPLVPRASARATSVPVAYRASRERSGSATATLDRHAGGAGDAELRRKLHETTKRYDDLHVKYAALEALGQTNAEANFTRLQRASAKRARDASELISALREEVAELRVAAARRTQAPREAEEGWRRQVDALTTALEEGKAEREELKAKLTAAQNASRALEAKLGAARLQIANGGGGGGPDGGKGPDKTAGGRHASASAAVGAGAVNANEAQREAKMKENLYADLTGLLIRNVKRHEGEDVYDCIQTGRNGTLHFHLTVAHDASTPHPKTPAGLSYEEAEFAYEPLLDPGRDRDLLQLLPDYLTEEICFPRQHAQKFYTRILDSMSKKIELEDD